MAKGRFQKKFAQNVTENSNPFPKEFMPMRVALCSITPMTAIFVTYVSKMRNCTLTRCTDYIAA